MRGEEKKGEVKERKKRIRDGGMQRKRDEMGKGDKEKKIKVE